MGQIKNESQRAGNKNNNNNIIIIITTTTRTGPLHHISINPRLLRHEATTPTDRRRPGQLVRRPHRPRLTWKTGTSGAAERATTPVDGGGAHGEERKAQTEMQGQKARSAVLSAQIPAGDDVEGTKACRGGIARRER
ncbi:uncharacterized protein HMPREF1120_05748 [Exophiala dermatitidis NIH/UT8656]|uniref:Uncharacterized protein n=1 Tax=Exophiala dermatitidis (strain ATCC 34100 / CBS 525.76 / NIH/UT8656) TaxID=858893 RepID=H6C1D6_EXODN|nr:uncharacterized protein HMPREF1120_05748 [Exophiala dermatitidis NIH/UT8656]EHY57721.1 hypothetical protein HMPREF1120_05748 [Exophiala dermatitidis NIH/UT8656]